MTTLPTLHPVAQDHSDKLVNFIRQAISRGNGHIPFAEFMKMALYAPGLGYYSAGAHKLGRYGDFVTAPELSPLFAQCVAQQCRQVLMGLGGGDILEFGAGSGEFAKDILLELFEMDCLPNHYYIVEISPDLRARQETLLRYTIPDLVHRVTWLNGLPTLPIRGVIFANEVLDAMPVHSFRIHDNTIKERCVTWNNNSFEWTLQSPSNELKQRLMRIISECPLPNDYESEVNMFHPAWIKTLEGLLRAGLILLIDYGYGRREYYHPDRSRGTLMCFYQHQKHIDPLVMIGLQDITAHVDFTTIAESAADAGLNVAGYTNQATFLIACGLLELATHIASFTDIEKYEKNQAIKRLTLPSQMGEIIKAMALTKKFDTPLLGFSVHDRRRDL